MPATATDDPSAGPSVSSQTAEDLDPRLLDALVPPPPAIWKRSLVWALVLGALATATWSVGSGRAVPRADVFVSSWGGAGPVEVTVEVTNRSPVAIEVVDGPAAPDGMRLLGRQALPEASTVAPAPPEGVGEELAPVRVEAGERVVLASWFSVESCAVVGRSERGPVGVVVRIADGPARAVELTRTGALDGLPGDPSWASAATAAACR